MENEVEAAFNEVTLPLHQEISALKKDKKQLEEEISKLVQEFTAMAKVAFIRNLVVLIDAKKADNLYHYNRKELALISSNIKSKYNKAKLTG